jgi:hypothetical protein
LKTLAPEPIDGIVVWFAHPGKPHKADVLLQSFFYLTAAVNIIDVSIYQGF